jgi:probable HAF family extracellular repeat protein
MAIHIRLLNGRKLNHNNKFAGRTLGVLVLNLLCLYPSSTWAVGYSVALLTPEKIKNTTYSIRTGNQSLNNKGQVIGERREVTSDGVFTFGWRAVLWTSRKMQALGTLGTDANYYGESIPTAINDAGQVAGYSSYFVNGIDWGLRAFLWDSSKKIRRINTDGAGFFAISPPIHPNITISINTKGDISGDGYYEKGVSRGNRAFVTLNGKIKNLGSLGADANGNGIGASYVSPNSYTGGNGSSLNNKGHVVGASSYYDKTGKNLGSRAFLWANNKLVNLGALGVDSTGLSDSQATAINDNDQVVGNSSYFNKAGTKLGDHAFIWVNGKMTDLGLINASPDGSGDSRAIAINAVGQVLGNSTIYKGNFNTGPHGFLWFKGKMTDLGTLWPNQSQGWRDSYPFAFNNKGQVVGASGYYDNGLSGVSAFLYQNGKMLDLNTLLPKNSGWLLDNALAINDKGQITVHGTYSKGINSYKAYALLTPK